MSFVTTVEPVREPFTASEIRESSIIERADDDAYIDDLIRGVRAGAEAYLKRRLLTQTVSLTLNGFPKLIELPIAPIQSIVSITYVDDAGGTQLLDSANYQLVISQVPNSIAPAYGLSWPVTRLDFDSVTVLLKVGYGDLATAIPSDILQAMRLKIAHYYENREAASTQQMHKIPYGVEDNLIRHVLWV